MRHVRMLGLCLVAVFAIAAIAATSASAAKPEWGQCYEKAGGKYANAGCTTKAKKGAGAFEWRKGSEVTHRHFTGEGGTGILDAALRDCVQGNQFAMPGCEGKENPTEEESHIQVECKTEHATGEASGKNEVKGVLVIFHECVGLGTAPCSNTQHEGEIQVNVLKGTLGYINKSNKEVGVDLNPAVKHGEFAQFSCLGVITTVVGEGGHEKVAGHTEAPVYAGGGGDGIISPITPVDTMTNTFTQVYTVNEATDENIPSAFEGGKRQLLETYIFAAQEEPETDRTAWGKAGESITDVNTAEEAVEIKA